MIPARIGIVTISDRASQGVYGDALSLPTGLDDSLFAAGMALRYNLSLQKSAACLAVAKALCQQPLTHYKAALDATIELVAGGPWP